MKPWVKAVEAKVDTARPVAPRVVLIAAEHRTQQVAKVNKLHESAGVKPAFSFYKLIAKEI